MRFISWEHPMVTGVIDMVLSQETGNTSLGSLSTRVVPRGSLLLECIYRLETARKEALSFLPPTVVRTIVDHKGNDLGERISTYAITNSLESVDANTAKKIVESQRENLRKMISNSQTKANHTLPAILEKRHQRVKEMYTGEIERLMTLRKQNPSVRQEEINFFKERLNLTESILNEATLQLDAVRIIVTT